MTKAGESRVRELYMAEPWGQLVARLGYDPIHMESQARIIARAAAIIITELEAQAVELRKAIQLADGIMAYCQGDAWERECTEEDRKAFDEICNKLELLP